ncbi:unnamed protein product [Gongylonema pulchrum]|uniref:UNC93-like protein n=1 Tax=Gongylonema pulchrum TaxID=637853 RepID=A0A183D1U0_9BILA|nr:unnamed protein product [Gongylonema pulchrum]
MNKLKLGRASSSKATDEAPSLSGIERAPTTFATALPLLMPASASFQQQSPFIQTTPVSDHSVFVLDEPSSPVLPPKKPTTSSYRFSFRDTEHNNPEEKCAYLFRGDSLYNKPQNSGANDKVERVHVYDPFCPIHGSRRRLNSKKPKIRDVDYHLTSIESVDDTEPSGVILLSQAFAAKLIRKRRRALLSGPEKYRSDKAKRKIRVNLWIVSMTFLFLFTAIHGLQNLQTSINGHLGTDSLSIFYASLSISYLFVPSFVLNRLGCKRTLIASSGIFMIYMLSNFLPKSVFRGSS